jgi:hypothetical protein
VTKKERAPLVRRRDSALRSRLTIAANFVCRKEGSVVNQVKIATGTFIVVGIVLGFIELRYAPRWLPRGMGWFLYSLMAIFYLVIDYLASQWLPVPIYVR